MHYPVTTAVLREGTQPGKSFFFFRLIFDPENTSANFLILRRKKAKLKSKLRNSERKVKQERNYVTNDLMVMNHQYRRLYKYNAVHKFKKDLYIYYHF